MSAAEKRPPVPNRRRAETAAEGEKPRDPNDHYPTDARLCAAICARLFARVGDFAHIIEPSAGGGAFVRAARERWPLSRITAIEPRPEPHFLWGASGVSQLLANGADASIADTWERYAEPLPSHGLLILGNPPFTHALRHIALALERMGQREATEPRESYLAFVLPTANLHGEERFTALYDTAAELTLAGEQTRGMGGLRWIMPHVQRAAFGEEGAAGFESSTFVWQVGYAGKPEVDWLSWR
jgi:hypothetical protein